MKMKSIVFQGVLALCLSLSSSSANAQSTFLDNALSNIKGVASAFVEGAVSSLVIVPRAAVHLYQNGNFDDFEYNVFEAEKETANKKQAREKSITTYAYNIDSQKLLESNEELAKLNNEIIKSQKYIISQNETLIDQNEEIIDNQNETNDKLDQALNIVTETRNDIKDLKQNSQLILNKLEEIHADIKHINYLVFMDQVNEAAKQGPEAIKAFITLNINKYANNKNYQKLVLKSISAVIDQGYYLTLKDLSKSDKPAILYQAQKELLEIGQFFVNSLEHVVGEYAQSTDFDVFKRKAQAAAQLAENLHRSNIKTFLKSNKSDNVVLLADLDLKLAEDNNRNKKRLVKFYEENPIMRDIASLPLDIFLTDFVAQEDQLTKIINESALLKEHQKKILLEKIRSKKAELSKSPGLNNEEAFQQLEQAQKEVENLQLVSECELILASVLEEDKEQFLSKMHELTLLKLGRALIKLDKNKDEDLVSQLDSRISEGSTPVVLEQRKIELAKLKYTQNLSDSEYLLSIFIKLQEFQQNEEIAKELRLDAIDFSLLKNLKSLEAKSNQKIQIFDNIEKLRDSLNKKPQISGELVFSVIDNDISHLTQVLSQMQDEVISKMEKTGCYEKYFTDQRETSVCGDTKADRMIESEGFYRLLKFFSHNSPQFISGLNSSGLSSTLNDAIKLRNKKIAEEKAEKARQAKIKNIEDQFINGIDQLIKSSNSNGSSMLKNVKFKKLSNGKIQVQNETYLPRGGWRKTPGESFEVEKLLNQGELEVKFQRRNKSNQRKTIVTDFHILFKLDAQGNVKAEELEIYKDEIIHRKKSHTNKSKKQSKKAKKN